MKQRDMNPACVCILYLRACPAGSMVYFFSGGEVALASSVEGSDFPHGSSSACGRTLLWVPCPWL